MKDWKTVKKGKYLYAKLPDHPNSTEKGYVLEHRVVMERFLGRFLTDDEVVHHIDEDTHNNKIENLRVMSKSEHGKLHKKTLKMECRVCPNCGVEFIRRPKGKYDEGREPKCSRKCNGEYSRRFQVQVLGGRR